MRLTPDQKDAIQELLNIGVGRAAGSLNGMLEKPISLHIPSIAFGTLPELKSQLEITTTTNILSSVHLPFHGSFSGSASLMFPLESAPKLVAALTGEPCEDDDFDTLKEATLTEIGNIVLNGVMGSLGNVLSRQMIYAVPSYHENTILGLLGLNTVPSLGGHNTPPESTPYLLWGRTRFTVQEFDLSGDILLMFDVGDIQKFTDAIADMADAIAVTTN